MNKHSTLTMEMIEAYGQHLHAAERSRGTIEKYLRDLRVFARWLDGRPVAKEAVSEWKEHLLACGYAPATVNSMLAALNGLFLFQGWTDCRVKFIKIQRRIFRAEDRELTQPEYKRLLTAAWGRGLERLALLMETICATGIRVSEVQYITVEAAKRGRTDISLKGKIRTILLPNKLCRKLLKYAAKNKTASGAIFRTRNGKSLTRHQIWSELKGLCQYAGVAASKVFPHNLRHLFAISFYQACKDIAKLADVLGHSSIETTRIYLMTSGKEHARQLEQLGLIN